ncbi:MAG: tyrosine-protein phosphatase [Actinomycetota bacterium]
MIEDRFIEFEGAFNVRDLGGLPTTDGRSVRSGRVYRADSPLFLTDADHDRVAALDVGYVLDLRSGVEAEEGTWAVAAGMARQQFEIIDPAQNSIVNPASAPAVFDEEVFARRYIKRLDEGGPAFVEAATALTRNVDDGVLFHCSAGKDRTGLLAAFVLSALGVERELIVADYGASSEPMRRKFAHHQANPDANPIDFSRVPPLMLDSPAPVMAMLLEFADERWGGIVARFQEAGFGDDDLAELRAKMLV